MERGALEIDRRAQLSPLKTAETSVCDVLASPESTIPSSPSSSDGDRRFSLHSIKDRARRSLSTRGLRYERSNSSSSNCNSRQGSHLRKLSKSRPNSTSSFSLSTSTRRTSSFSTSELSTADTPSTIAPNSNVDWQAQRVEAIAPLEPDPQLFRTKTAYLAVTSDYLIKLKSRGDALALFPFLAENASTAELESTTTGSTASSVPELPVVIPLASIVSVFPAESTRPSFGMEVWWKSGGVCFHQASFFFSLPSERDTQIHVLVQAMRSASRNDESDNDASRPSPEIVPVLNQIQLVAEPAFQHRKLQVFPVVPRAELRKEYMSKMEDSAKKPQEVPAFYLAVGTYLCHLIVVQKGKAGEPVRQMKSFGLVTLHSVKGDWAAHEERFNLSFRSPFKQRETLELASRYYRRIIRILGMADRFLKPIWPQTWQTAEIFKVTGLREPQYLVPREDFGSVRRTIDAYTAAYTNEEKSTHRNPPLEWEINWKTKFPPEFRLLPAKDGSRYSALQLLAVLRALRYNDYFTSLSFRGVDLGPLWGLHDQYAMNNGSVAYLSRTGVTLDSAEVQALTHCSILHQEFHALAFCSETIQQINFTNSLASLSPWKEDDIKSSPGLQFLMPILHLLQANITKCDHLILAGNSLHSMDIELLVATLRAGKIQTLDVSSTGLCERALRHLVSPFLDLNLPMRSLNLSDNPGRLPAGILPRMLRNLVFLRELNIRGSLQGESEIIGTLIPIEVFERLEHLEELDLSGFKLNDATLHDIGNFLRCRDPKTGGRRPSQFRRLTLNHCGITGDQAGKLCQSMSSSDDLHLSISGNQLEEGVLSLASAIRGNSCPTGLHMEEVEFKLESNYIHLIRALAATQRVTFLSLAGTAPTPLLHAIHEPCSAAMVDALSSLFAQNTSIEYLDLSGMSGRLEDGQLARGFARSLSGLENNTTLAHLKIRNQNFHDDIGILGRVLSTCSASGLRIVDVQDNGLNLTSLKFLIDSVCKNDRIVELPFSPLEREAIWTNIVHGLRKASLPTPSSSRQGTKSSLSAAKPATDQLRREQEQVLRPLFERQFKILDAHLRRNREALGQESGGGQLPGFHDGRSLGDGHSSDGSTAATAIASPGGGAELDETWVSQLSPPSSPTPVTRAQRVSMAAMGGTGCDSPGPSSSGSSTAAATPTAGPPQKTQPRSMSWRTTVRSSLMGAVVPAPYQSRPYGYGSSGEGVESPTETLDPVSEISTPPEGEQLAGSGEQGEEEFERMMERFREAGMEMGK